MGQVNGYINGTGRHNHHQRGRYVMIKTTSIYVCDVCGVHQSSDGKDMKACAVFAGGVEKIYHDHVCKSCRHKLYVAIGREVHDLRGTG